MRALAVAAVVAWAGPGFAGTAPPSTYEIEATVLPDLATIEGTVRAEIVNDTDAPVDALTLWLYPNVFASTPAGVTAVNREHYQPAGPGLGGLDLLAIRRVGDRLEAEPIEAPPAPPGTARLLRLPVPLPPGESTSLVLEFRTRVPERLGPLSTNGRTLTALGGWHPYATAGDVRRRGDGRRPPDATFVATVRVPPTSRARVGRDLADGPARFRGPFLPLWVRPAGVHPLPTSGGNVWPERPRPEAGRGCTFPDPAPIPGEWSGDDLATLLAALQRWADDRSLPASGPIDLFVVPLASEVALATGGGVAVSNRFYSVPPLDAVRRLHDRALARAVLAERLLPWVRARESPADVPQVADALGAYFASRFVEESQGQAADVAGLLSLLDFIPSLDDFLRSPKSAFPHVYFLPVAEAIPVRDEPWTFNVTAPRGNLALAKLADRVGDAAVARAVARYLAPGAREPFLATLEATAGEELGGYWRAWTSRIYREDLRVRRLEEAEVPGGFRTAVEVERVGDAPPEAIEVAVDDAAGSRRILTWRAREGERLRRFEVETPAPVVRLVVDPRRRVTQAAAASSELSALGDVDPARVQLLLTRLGFAYSVPDRSPYGEVELVLRRRDDVRRRFGLGAAYRRDRVGARSYLGFGFGPLVDAARYAYSASLGIEGDYLRAGFGDEARSGFGLGPTLGLGFDNRPPVPTADRGDAWSVGISASTGFASGGASVLYAGLGAGALHLEPLGKGHSLALRLRASALLGAPPVQELLPLGGTDEGIRGFTLEEVLAARRVVGGIEWRVPLLRALDENLLVGRLRSVGGTLFAEAAWMGDIYRSAGSRPRPASAFFGDAGAGLRFRYDFLGVQPLVLSLDAAVPAGRLGGIDRLPVTVQLRAGQPFSTP